ncbi:MAG: sigma-54 dependent transcriptional regulator [Flavobacteriaceae bacterium]|nr:sigma-54 dependent transcriptional regulator [Flavobacteriaceae bacterium]MCY4217535.1 sigma-54 dependent transcriptional regulator [Flavobacteriaceae bacterium]MCY4254118.1 sigma-54 dependent transcriptional regulator [Flavobacteriaceae bacterium]
MNTILIVDDLEANRKVLSRILKERETSYRIILANDGSQGLKKIKENTIDTVLCDIKMPVIDGVELLKRTRKSHPNLPFIMLTAHGDVDTAVDCMKMGAYDFLTKPFDLNKILTSVKNALKSKSLETENKQLKGTIKELNKVMAKKYDIVGESPSIIEVNTLIQKVSKTTARVLITGESGAGKELVARQLHILSHRKVKKFVEVNCAAIPTELIESELFGHIKGAFTGAHTDRSGKFEDANHGTLFLDEIADMSLAAQSKVLRALEEKKVFRVGSQKEIKVDVRVIAATNKNLKKEIQDGRFREDLYHRLAIIEIHVPPLRERKQDIPILIDHFVKLLQRESGLEIKEFSQSAKEAMSERYWTGNVRELKNVVERLLILANNPITVDDIKTYVPKA